MQLNNSCNAYSSTDVIIVGGGLAGLSAALLLAQAQIKSIVIDRFAPFPGGRKLALNAHSVQIFQSLDVWSQLTSLSVPIHQIQVRVGEHFPKLRLRTSQPSSPPGHVIRIEHLAQALLDSCQRSDDITLLQDECIDLKTDQAFATLHLRSGKAIKGKLILGADGENSVVRQLSHCQWHSHPYQQKALVFEAQLSKMRPHQAIEWFIKEGTLAVLPLPEKRHAVIWTAPSGHEAFHFSKPEQIENWLTELTCAQLGECHLSTPAGQYPLAKSFSSDPFAARVFLLGNAAHVLHPVAAQGFNLGLKNAKLLIDALMAQKNLNQDLGQTALLSRVALKTIDNFKSTLWGCDILASHASGQRWPEALKAGALLGLEYCPTAKRQITQWGTGETA